MEIWNNYNSEEIGQNEIHVNFSCDKYDCIRKKEFSDISEVSNIKLV